MPTDDGGGAQGDAASGEAVRVDMTDRAQQRMRGWDVAVRVIEAGMDDLDRPSEFERACRVLCALSRHPHIVTVRETGWAGGRGYILVDLMEEGSLGEWVVTDGRLPFREALEVAVKLAGALETLHRAGVVHGNLGPHSILVSSAGDPQLGDLDLAVLARERPPSPARRIECEPYLAPELRDGAEPSVATDLYALGGTMFALITGTHAPTCDDDLRPSLRACGVPDCLTALVERCVATQPDARPESASALGLAIQDIQRDLGFSATELIIDDEVAQKAREAAQAESSAGDGPPVAADHDREPPEQPAIESSGLPGAPATPEDLPAEPEATEPEVAESEALEPESALPAPDVPEPPLAPGVGTRALRALGWWRTVRVVAVLDMLRCWPPRWPCVSHPTRRPGGESSWRRQGRGFRVRGSAPRRGD